MHSFLLVVLPLSPCKPDFRMRVPLHGYASTCTALPRGAPAAPAVGQESGNGAGHWGCPLFSLWQQLGQHWGRWICCWQLLCPGDRQVACHCRLSLGLQGCSELCVTHLGTLTWLARLIGEGGCWQRGGESLKKDGGVSR